MTEELHREVLEDHARIPRGQDPLIDFTAEAYFQSAKTGNSCSVRVKWEDDQRIQKLSAQVRGSALSQACASIMVCELEGRTVEEASNLAKGLCSFLEEGKDLEISGDLSVYRSIVNFPDRFDCALLAWRAYLKTCRL